MLALQVAALRPFYSKLEAPRRTAHFYGLVTHLSSHRLQGSLVMSLPFPICPVNDPEVDLIQQGFSCQLICLFEFHISKSVTCLHLYNASWDRFRSTTGYVFESCGVFVDRN